MRIHTSFASLAGVVNPIVTIGTFDGVHLGHKSIIERLKEIALRVGGETVLLTFYPHPRMVLHPEDHGIQLINSPEEKAGLLEAAGIDHLVVYPFSLDFSRMTPFEYVRDLLVTGLHTHTVVVGYDHRFGRNREGNHTTLTELAETFNFAVEEINPRVIDDVNVSSTKIRAAIVKGDMKEANKFLGYPYSLQGTVVHGDEIGRTLGYPTANILPDYPFKLVPHRGIYAAWVFINGVRHNAVMSIGIRPTVTSNPEEKIEVYILDFNEDIYGEKLDIKILEYLREEKKFGSIDELINQIAKDVEMARSMF